MKQKDALCSDDICVYDVQHLNLSKPKHLHYGKMGRRLETTKSISAGRFASESANEADFSFINVSYFFLISL